MSENNERKIPDFITYAREFDGYRWYKPIIVLAIMMILISIVSTVIVYIFLGGDLSAIQVMGGGYDGLNTYTFKGLISLLGTGLLLP